MEGATHPPDPRRVALLLEHVAAIDSLPPRPSAHERLERLVGGQLARLLVGALAGGQRPRHGRV